MALDNNKKDKKTRSFINSEMSSGGPTFERIQIRLKLETQDAAVYT